MKKEILQLEFILFYVLNDFSLTLVNKILVPLPEPEARRAMFEELLPSVPGEEKLPYDLMVERTEGYSGSDIRLLCKEAAMQPLRRLMAHLEDKAEVVPEEGMNFLEVILHEIEKFIDMLIIAVFLCLLYFSFLPERGIIEGKKKYTISHTHMHAFKKKSTPSYFYVVISFYSLLDFS